MKVMKVTKCPPPLEERRLWFDWSSDGIPPLWLRRILISFEDALESFHSILGEMYAVLLWLNSLKRHLLFFLFSALIKSQNSSVSFAINRSRSSLWLSHCLAVSIICSVEVKSKPLCARSVAWAYLWCWVHFISYMDPYFSIVVKVSYRMVFENKHSKRTLSNG